MGYAQLAQQVAQRAIMIQFVLLASTASTFMMTIVWIALPTAKCVLMDPPAPNAVQAY